METIRYLLGVIIKLALGLFLLAFVLWLVGFLYPQFSLSNVFSGNIFKRDILPAPRDYSNLFVQKDADGQYGRLHVLGESYNNNARQEGVDFVVYSMNGPEVIKAKGSINTGTFDAAASGYADRTLYIRNLSIFGGGIVYHGMTFTGEARNTMFKNGIFTILVLEANGKVLASAPAINTGVWAVPGWGRFQATIPSKLPVNTPCALVFLSANQPVKVGIPVRCN